jgi:DNA modification methylase
MAMNTLYLGDCLYVLRENVPDESVDLIYIDPPFNSKRDYNIFFDDREIQSQRIAFEDTWTLKNIQDSLAELHTMKTEHLYYLLLTYQKVAPHAFPYLTMMSLRLIELHRVLKPTGSFYLHCDPTMSHYLKTVCDIIFGGGNFVNEIIWRRTASHNARRSYGPIHDVILFYGKSNDYEFNIVYRPYMKGHVLSRYTEDKNGKFKFTSGGNILTGAGATKGESGKPWRGFNPSVKKRHWAIPGFLAEQMPESFQSFSILEKLEALYKAGLIEINPGAAWPTPVRYLLSDDGVPIQDIWAYQPYTEETVHGTDEGIDADVAWLGTTDPQRLGYPTQKPKGLLDRIIKASSNEGDVVLDAFCGCGTTIDAAEGLHRKWIGIDISPIAISLIKRRLRHTYKKSLSEFEVRGIPTDEQSAMKLWKENPFAFQDWWISEFDVFSSTYGTKGADRGVDGIGLYALDDKGSTLRVAFQVKGGENVQSKDIDALTGAMAKHKCEMGVFLTAAEPTKPMLETTTDSGFVKVPGFAYPKLQIITLKEYFSGKRPKLPATNITFKAAQHTGKKAMGQLGLEME